MAASLAAFVLVFGIVLGAVTAVHLLRAPADVLSPMVPESTAVYTSAYLQPSGSQLLALSSLAAKFPAIADSAKRTQWIDGLLDDALSGTGLNHGDVLPWLGAQVGLSVDAQGLVGTGGPGSAYALYMSTLDDAGTQAALLRWRTTLSTSQSGTTYGFTTQPYHGVTVTNVIENIDNIFQNISSSLGAAELVPGTTPATATAADTTPFLSYAIVDHVLVIAGSNGYLDRVIDTDQGRAAGIGSSADYRTVVGQLPSDRLGIFFLDYPAVLQALQSELGGLGSAGTSIQPELGVLKAYRGMGVSAAAQAGGLAIDSVTDYDRSQLSADQQKVLGTAPDDNAAAAITPASAAAFYGFAGTQYLVREVLDSLEQITPDIGSYLAQSGLGPALLDLTGDFGVELDSRAGSADGALIVGTDNAAATRQFLDATIPSVIGQTVIPGAGATAANLSHVTYRGVDITVYSLPSAGTNLAWTVTHGDAIVATSSAEMDSIIDTIDGAPSLARSPGYSQSAGAATSVAVGYLDMAQLTGLIDRSLPADMQAGFEQNVVPNLRPISSVSMTESSTPDQSAAHVVIAVP